MYQTKTRDAVTYQIVVAIFLLSVLIAVVVPLWRVIVTAFTPLNIYTREGVPFFLSPLEWTPTAFEQLLSHPLFPRAMLNSLIITLSGTALSLILTVPLAYGLSARSLPGRRIIMLLILFTFLFHPGLVPTYLLVTKLELTNTFFAVTLPPAISVYNTLVMMSFFEGLPEELKEAARIDGANELQVLRQVVLPLSKPILLTIGLFYAVYFWNEFFTPILYLNDNDLMPLPVLLRNILISASFNEYVEFNAFSSTSIESLKSAAVLITMLPMLLVYPWIQRYFTKGTLLGAVKE
ncbi:MAG: carbohydrate ABC transporter permease [Chloroflexi bacterium]|nr:carbohydrate ABC transporter permease [Chloroflexota bacterium]MCI0577762.1 carbohydrate ABC transporter permease [Chloroflexota bacterium]MCI0643432.1 carbohydrate ABC transporter permease [Chloroflexota bacterium]MCI0725909.1 carbohydrate ABC transporter permease [Chloroflexota bacterium]